MSERDSYQATLDLARFTAAALREGHGAGHSLLAACVRCREARVPDVVTGVGLAVWRHRGRSADPSGLARRDDLGEILARARRNRAANFETLRSVAAWVQGQPGRRPVAPVLLGDMAVMQGLYGCHDAWEASLWVVAVDLEEALPEPAMPAVTSMMPHDFHAGTLGALAERLGRSTAEMELDGVRWHIPEPDLLATVLAARVGDPEALPMPPVWFHLAVGLLTWRDRLHPADVLDLAEELGLGQKVQRGLAIVAQALPELNGWVPKERLEIPIWERLLALPLAARRVVSGTAKGAGLDEDE